MTTLAPIIEAVQQATKLCRTIQAAGAAASTKGDDSPVTIADYGAQTLICRAIQGHFPGEGVIAEEGGAAFGALVSAEGQNTLASLLSDIIGETITPADIVATLDYGQDTQGERIWVIDPIDGTVGFVNNRYYAICVGLMENAVPTQAVMGLPHSPIDTYGSILYTEGDNVLAMSINGDNLRQVQASGRTPTDDDLLIMESFKLSTEERADTDAVREWANLADAKIELYDSQLKYAMVAAGYADVFARIPRDVAADPHKIWDHAPGAALLRAAGATMTDTKGNPIDFSQGTALPHDGFLATNGNATLHQHMLDGLRKLAEQG